MNDFPASAQSWIGGKENTSWGFFAEYVYQEVQRSRGFALQKTNFDRYDFIVGGQRVDVKSKRPLSSTRSGYRPEKPSVEIAGVHYPLLCFLRDCAVIYWPDPDGKTDHIELEWTRVDRLLRDYLSADRVKVETAVTTEVVSRREACQTLKTWILETWQATAAIVYRSTEKVTSGMESSGWGPEAFYQDPMKRQVPDIVVLVYFNGTDVTRVFAYPMQLSASIAWTKRDKGEGRKPRMTFDPKDLAPEFKFKDLAEFRNEFPMRFHTLNRPGYSGGSVS